uniref:Uncharacterized protein n=1 Tax=Trichuris muris TaxID=70415 RepID=A0A5S6Q9M0_TRIMR
MRKLAAEVVSMEMVKIDGDGLTVELDEALFSRRKCNVGRLLPQQWVFGLCRETQEVFAIRVKDRSSATLIELIKKHVHPWVHPPYGEPLDEFTVKNGVPLDEFTVKNGVPLDEFTVKNGVPLDEFTVKNGVPLDEFTVKNGVPLDEFTVKNGVPLDEFTVKNGVPLD